MISTLVRSWILISYLPRMATSGRFTIQRSSILVLYFKKEKKKGFISGRVLKCTLCNRGEVYDVWNAHCAIEVKFMMFWNAHCTIEVEGTFSNAYCAIELEFSVFSNAHCAIEMEVKCTLCNRGGGEMHTVKWRWRVRYFAMLSVQQKWRWRIRCFQIIIYNARGVDGTMSRSAFCATDVESAYTVQ